MFEELYTQLDELGVEYTEDVDVGVVTIDIAEMEKSLLIDVISMLTTNGYVFNITADSITVETTEIEEPVEEYDEDAYLDDAFAQM